MLKTMKPFITVAALGFATSAFAADLYEPPLVTMPPPPPQVVEEQVAVGGWYLRGDLNYHWSDLGDVEYITYGCCTPEPGTHKFDSTDLKGALSLGGGVGYQITRYLRADLTADYWFKSDFRGSTSSADCGNGPCSSTDTSAYSALLLMANAYVDLGTYHGVTPYVGAGVGGAYVKWDDLENTINGSTDVHKGVSDWRFAWSLMAGASYCLTENLQLDAGYRYTRIEGGRMFEYATPSGGGIGAGPGFDDGFNVHEARAGLRYTFGGNTNCSVPQVVAYDPPPYEYDPPVYK